MIQDVDALSQSFKDFKEAAATADNTLQGRSRFASLVEDTLLGNDQRERSEYVTDEVELLFRKAIAAIKGEPVYKYDQLLGIVPIDENGLTPVHSLTVNPMPAGVYQVTVSATIETEGSAGETVELEYDFNGDKTPIHVDWLANDDVVPFTYVFPLEWPGGPLVAALAAQVTGPGSNSASILNSNIVIERKL